MAKAAAEARAAYRHLLRRVPQAAGHSRAATKNIRRMMGDSVRHQCQESATSSHPPQQQHAHFLERARSTLLLFLAATQDQKVHRLLANLASLCYHHLSPHTAMQPNERSRRIGGTDAPSLRRLRARQSERKYGGGGGKADVHGDLAPPATVNTDMALISLCVPGRRPRGPVVSASEARALISQRWNGQNVSRFVKHAEARKLEMELEDILAAVAEKQGEEQRHSTNSEQDSSLQRPKLSPEARARAKEIRSQLKATRRADAEESQMISLRNDSEKMLARVVARAEKAGFCNAFIGSSRFNKLARKEWLAP